MTTKWKYRLYLFVRAVDNTAANRQAFAEIFVNNGSGESLDDEKKMFNNAIRLSTSGDEPAQAFGLHSAVTLAMRDDLKAFLDGLTNARYVVAANTRLPNYADNELVLTNFDVVPSGQIVTNQNVMNYLENEFGLIQIHDDSEV